MSHKNDCFYDSVFWWYMINSATLVFPCVPWFYLAYKVTIKSIASKLDTYNLLAITVHVDIFRTDDFVFHQCARAHGPQCRFAYGCIIDDSTVALMKTLAWGRPFHSCARREWTQRRVKWPLFCKGGFERRACGHISGRVDGDSAPAN